MGNFFYNLSIYTLFSFSLIYPVFFYSSDIDMRKTTSGWGMQDIRKVCELLYGAYQKEYHLSEKYIIPKLIHFVWLGGSLPKECEEMIVSWKKFHPTWEIKIWRDKDIAPFDLQNQAAFDQAGNYGEKSDIFRYEILYRYGGVYIDTDFECLQSFDNIHRSCEFYTGFIGPKSIPNGLIGSKPGHPILKACIENIKIGSGDSCPNRIFEDTGPYLFTKMFLIYITMYDRSKIVLFPPSFFYSFPATSRGMKDKEVIKQKFVKPESMAVHYWHSTWY